MSRIPAPTLSHRLFFASRSRVFLCLLTAALIWLFSTQLLTLRGSYVPAQLISTPPADVEHSQQPTLPTSSQNAPLQTPELTHESARLPCESLQGLEDVFLIVRTGASEALEKLPVHFNTTLRCLPQNSYGIWSDLEETIDCHYVGNALDELSSSTINEHPDFGYYRRLQENGRAGFSVEEMTRWASAPNSASGRNTLGWKLDKWKFLPLAKKAYRQRPDAKWFIFTECDGYINWTSLLSWLSHHDPSTPYVGQLMVIGDVVFAYGGASFVVSNNAMKAVTEHYTADAEKYEDFTGHHWAGDCVLGKALKDIEIDFTQAWPTFLGDSPFDVNYNSSVSGPDRHLWCYYAMTWHHLSPFGMREFSAFEEDWNSKVIPCSLSTDKRGPPNTSLIAFDIITPRRCFSLLHHAEA
ncbi:hypothetical protein SCUP234_01039 [Seiridium cupressi]